MTAPLPPPLDELPPADRVLLEPYLESVRFRAGDCILRMGSVPDACFVIDEGDVRIEIEREEVDSETVLTHLGPGSMVGELGLLDKRPRSAAAYADSDVAARRISAAGLDRLSREHPAIALAVVSALGRDAALKLRETTGRLADALPDKRPDADGDVDQMVRRAADAQAAFEAWDDARVDALLFAFATACAERAEALATLTVEETRLGNVADKTIKNRVASLGIYRALAGKPTRGAIGSDEARKVTELASPMGVIFGIIPLTNPVATAVFKILIALKGRNALILSFPHQCLRIADAVSTLTREALEAHGAPLDLVQCIAKRTSRRKTARFMAHDGIALILATGGAGMVKAAYSSGRPAIGVGPGNAPALICADADVEAAAAAIVHSKSFDNGLICGAEHNLVVDASVRSALIAALEQRGAAVLTAEEAALFTAKAIDPRRQTFRLELIGQSAQAIADAVGIQRASPIRIVIVETAATDVTNPYAGEKMAPLLSLFTVSGEEQGLAVCAALLRHTGAGHTAIVHTRNMAFVDRFAETMRASRILVNGPGTQGSCGLSTGLECSFTLGCGTFGGNSTTDNVTYRHLLNIKRVAYPLEKNSGDLGDATIARAMAATPTRVV